MSFLGIVFGIGTFTYQGVTRDTFGQPIKATFGIVNPLLDRWWMNLSKRVPGAPFDSLPAPIRLAAEALYREVLRQAERMAGESVSALKDQVEQDREAVSAATEHLQAERSGVQALGDAVRQELCASAIKNFIEPLIIS